MEFFSHEFENYSALNYFKFIVKNREVYIGILKNPKINLKCVRDEFLHTNTS